MDISAIVSVISNVGFPIGCFVYMCWYLNQKDKDHKNEIDKLSEAVNNNTLAITQLIDHIKRG